MQEDKPINNKVTFSMNKKRSRSTDSDEENKQVSQIVNGVKKAATRHNIPAIKQYDYIKSLALKNPDGRPEYMLARSWYVCWEKYCLDLTSEQPSGIDNSSLLHENCLKDNLTYEKDYMVVPEKAWNSLTRWYIRIRFYACPN